jgi:hypothetical protein
VKPEDMEGAVLRAGEEVDGVVATQVNIFLRMAA